MVYIKNSKFKCGTCGEVFEISWEIDEIRMTGTREMGEEYQYFASSLTKCPKCFRPVRLTLTFFEYPIGGLEGVPRIGGEEIVNWDNSPIETPRIVFLDT